MAPGDVEQALRAHLSTIEQHEAEIDAAAKAAWSALESKRADAALATPTEPIPPPAGPAQVSIGHIAGAGASGNDASDVQPTGTETSDSHSPG